MAIPVSELERQLFKSPQTTPAEMLKKLADNLGHQDGAYRVVLINHAFQDWSEALAILGGYERDMLDLPKEEIERPLFKIFCAQLRVEGADITPDEENAAFQAYLED